MQRKVISSRCCLWKNIEIVKIKLKGIIGCIKDYTDESAIENILKSLSKALSQNDYNIVLFSCKEIEKWYHKNINEILSNEYVYNKDVHKENIPLIIDIISELEPNEKEYKNELNVLANPMLKTCLNDAWLSNLFDRFHQIVIQLRDRYDYRDTLDVDDEYDVQDLLHALLRIYCDEIRTEEWTPSYAGTASRQDFY